jgi:hypothetical protein
LKHLSNEIKGKGKTSQTSFLLRLNIKFAFILNSLTRYLLGEFFLPSSADYLHQLFTPNFIVVNLRHAKMLSTNNTFGASLFADGAETRRHGKKERREKGKN